MQIEIFTQKKGEEKFFGSRENFFYLARNRKPYSRNIIPKGSFLLKNSFGINLLMDELVRIEHGVLA